MRCGELLVGHLSQSMKWPSCATDQLTIVGVHQISMMRDGEKVLFPLFTFLVATYEASIIRLVSAGACLNSILGCFLGFSGASFSHFVLLTRMDRIAVEHQSDCAYAQ
jgi:hypothetical protein